MSNSLQRLLARTETEKERWTDIANALLSDADPHDRGYALGTVPADALAGDPATASSTLRADHTFIAIETSPDTFLVARLDAVRAAVTTPMDTYAQVMPGLDSAWRF